MSASSGRADLTVPWVVSGRAGMQSEDVFELCGGA